MNLTEHFTLEEFVHSNMADRRGIDNTIPPELIEVATLTCDLGERIRAHLSTVAEVDCPIEVTSGYRCVVLNTTVGGQPGSDHMRALALDFKCPTFGSPLDICRSLLPVIDDLNIGQLIYEGDWVHVSIRPVTQSQNRVLTIKSGRKSLGIQG
jgi:hypothetical protein